jgi:hypothetical protein
MQRLSGHLNMSWNISIFLKRALWQENFILHLIKQVTNNLQTAKTRN